MRSGGGSALAGVASLVQTQGLSKATDETYVVNEYLKSRDMVRLLAERDNLRDILNRPEGDAISRFPNFYSHDDFEHLYEHFQRIVDVTLDEASGITTLRVVAYRPDDANGLATAVMAHAEALINRLNDRAHDDSMRYAQMIVDKARDKTAEVEANLTTFRNAHGTVNPAQESLAALSMIGRMSEELAKLEATLSRQIALTPSNPGIESLEQKIQSYRGRDRDAPKPRGRNEHIDRNGAVGLRIPCARTRARGEVARSGAPELRTSREEAQQKHLYIETVAEPSLPDVSEYPRRYLILFLVAVVAIGVWLILRSLRISASEHSV